MANGTSVALDAPMAGGRAGRLGGLIFGAILVGGVAFVGANLVGQLGEVRNTGSWAFILLGLALLVALGFEFVNGFHDTANAVATVIYTHSLNPYAAVVWSGLWNFLGVLTSSGAVAFGIVSLLPVELILQVGSGAGFAMVFALLVAAIVWNLGTWYFGLPSSSPHTHGSNDGQERYGHDHADPDRYRAHGVCAESCRDLQAVAGLHCRLALGIGSDDQVSTWAAPPSSSPVG